MTSLPFIDQLMPYLQWYFSKVPFPMSIVLPMVAVGIPFAFWAVASSAKKEVKVDKESISHTLTAREFASRQWQDNEGAYTLGDRRTEDTKEETQNHRNVDLEERLISALASAPWQVKEGSEIALEKKASNKWGIATKKIAFVMNGNGGASKNLPPVEPTIPENPDDQIGEEATA